MHLAVAMNIISTQYLFNTKDYQYSVGVLVNEFRTRRKLTIADHPCLIICLNWLGVGGGLKMYIEVFRTISKQVQSVRGRGGVKGGRLKGGD